jgi:hypothetical protein
MARLLTTGFETRLYTTSTATNGEGQSTAIAGTVTADTTNQYSGSACAKFGASSTFKYEGAMVTGRAYYVQTAIKRTGLENQEIVVVKNTNGNIAVEIFLNNKGELQLWTENSPAHTFLESGFISAANTYYLYELMFEMSATAGKSKVACKVRNAEGTVVYTSSVFEGAFGTTAPASIQVGNFGTQSGTTVYSSQVLVNDATGEKENSWVGYQKVVTLKPTADVANFNSLFSRGTSSVKTELYKAVSNTPPTGVVFASRTETSEIAGTGSTETGAPKYTGKLTTYTAAGVGASDTVEVVQQVGRVAQSSTTARAMKMEGVSNPAIAVTEGNTSASAGGTDPSNWTTIVGTATYSPSVTLGTAPEVAIAGAKAGTVMVDLLAMNVSYEPAPTAKTVELKAAGAGAGTGTAALTTHKNVSLTAKGAGEGTATAKLSRTVELKASGAGIGTASAKLIKVQSIKASGTGSGTATASLSVTHIASLKALGSGAGTATAKLTIVSAGKPLWTPAAAEPVSWWLGEDSVGTVNVESWPDHMGNASVTISAGAAGKEPPRINRALLNGHDGVKIFKEGGAFQVTLPKGEYKEVTFWVITQTSPSAGGRLFGSNQFLEGSGGNWVLGTWEETIKGAFFNSEWHPNGVTNDGLYHQMALSAGIKPKLVRADGSTLYEGESEFAFGNQLSFGGYGNSSEVGQGHVVEVVVIPRQLALEDVQRLEGYGAHKYALTLPEGHPYKEEPPYEDEVVIRAKGSGTGTGSASITRIASLKGSGTGTGTGSAHLLRTRLVSASGTATGTGAARLSGHSNVNLSAPGSGVGTGKASLSIVHMFALAANGTGPGTGTAKLSLSRLLGAKGSSEGIGHASLTTKEVPRIVFGVPAPHREEVTHAVAVTSKDGTVTRFGPDEDELRRTLISVSFETSIPGGFDNGEFTIPRPTKFEAIAAQDFQSLRLYDSNTNETFYAGRITGTPQVDDTTINIETQGWFNHLEDDKTAREIFIDRDVSKFGEDSLLRQKSLNTSNYAYVGNSNGGSDSVKQEFTALTVPPFQLASTTYYGSGVPLGKLRYDTAIGASISPGDTNWNIESVLSTDAAITAYQTSGDYNATATTNQTLNASTTNRFYANFFCAYVAALGTTNAVWTWLWNNVAIMGLHGLPERGTWPAVGFYVSDMVPYILNKWAPLLEYSTGVGGTVEPTTFIVQSFSPSEFSTANAMLGELCPFGGSSFYAQDYGCYGDTGREFFFRQPGSYGKTWIARLDQTDEDTDAGPDSTEFINGVVVTYSENGKDKLSVGPLNSGAQTMTAALEDTSPENPVNNDGARHWEVVDIGDNSLGAAELVGRLTLQTKNNRDWRGSITLKDTVQDEAGNEFSVGMVRAGDEIIVADDEDTKPRRIVSTSYGPNEVQASVGAYPDEQAALLARITNNQEATGV